MSHRLAKKLRREARARFGPDFNTIPVQRRIYQKVKSEATKRKKQRAQAPTVGEGHDPRPKPRTDYRRRSFNVHGGRRGGRTAIALGEEVGAISDRVQEQE